MAMTKKIGNLPNWDVQIDEASAGVYRLLAKHPSGSTIELTGTNPEELFAQAEDSARAMETELKLRQIGSTKKS